VSHTLAAPVEAQQLEQDHAFHLRLRERERRDFTPVHFDAARRARAERPSAAFSIATAVPSVGALMPLDVSTTCGAHDPRVGRVVAVTQQLVMVVDTANPRTAITDAEYRSFAESFDRDVYPVMAQNFGTPSDVDGNQRAIVFYTRAVNAMTPAGSSSYVGGYFWSGDLFPRTSSTQACPSSNYAEIFYMLAPDPDGVVNGNRREDDLIRRTTVATLAHEYQHLINASRRLYVNQASTWEEGWLNEGLSHIAEELMFYRVAGLQPRQNLTIDDLRASQARLDAFNQYQNSNYGRFIAYLRQAGNPTINVACGNQPTSPNTLIGCANPLETRGAAWAFLRYAADRRNGNDAQLWTELTNSRTAGLANLGAALGTDVLPWIRTWHTALFADDLVPGLDARFRTPSWNHRSVTAAYPNTNGQYPLRTVPLSGGHTGFELAGAAAAYARFGVAVGQRASLTLTSGGGPPAENLRITLVRTR
jgi:hypothetical protein